ncbi:MAG: type I restriction endonuclease [Acidithiobacillus sp.]
MPIGQAERQTQQRVIQLFQKTLGYQYLGGWQDRPDNRNIETELLEAFLTEQGHSAALIQRTLHLLNRAANDQTQGLYACNKAVYGLLRYGVPVKADAGEQTQTVFLIDWEHPERNHFGIAKEVTVNDSEDARYGTIGTPEKYYLTWKETLGNGDSGNGSGSTTGPVIGANNLLDQHLIHDFIIFDAGTKKTPHPNQYFGVKAAQSHLQHQQGGIIWHTQGSGKSLTMVWLAKWIREHMTDARVLIITDRTELDEQIEKVFKGVDEDICRSKSRADLIHRINSAEDWLLCSLIHKFGAHDATDVAGYIAELQKALPADFSPKGRFVDECHRTQSGELHKAMKAILPHAIFIGFTGTPLLKADKQKSVEVFGGYIHTYKFNEAVRDGVVLDLRYEARNIDQALTSPERIDQWFAAKTQGLTAIALVKEQRDY